MAESQYPTSGITLGNGGRITDSELVKELECAPILQPKELLKLAIYFSASPINGHLGGVLWQHGQATILVHPLVRRAALQAFGFDIVPYEDSYEESWENLFPIFDDDNDAGGANVVRIKRPSFDTSDTGESEVKDQSFLFTVILGIGLLIEKRRLENEEVAFYVLNVSPDPQKLPDPVARRAPAPASSK